MPENVGSAAGLGSMKPDARGGQLRPVQIYGAVDTRLQAFGYSLL